MNFTNRLRLLQPSETKPGDYRMIELKPLSSNLALQQNLSFENIIKQTYRCDDHYSDVCFDRKFKNLSIKEHVGNAALTANNLIFYPTLIKKIRALKNYPLYTINIDLTNISQGNVKGILPTIASLQQLDTELVAHREIKARLDANVNNLVMLYSQDKVMPIYEGAKPYYKNCYGRLNQAGHLIKISGINYFDKSSPKLFKKKTDLYQLCPRQLIKSNIDETTFYSHKLTHVRYLAGGIINTPIFIIRCAKEYKCRGKLVYFDLHNGKITTLLSIARKWAYNYAADYTIDNFEEKTT